MTKNDKKMIVLYNMLCALSPLYISETDEYIKDQYETTIGANLFYQDSSKKLFSGFISEGSIASDCVKEHKYPRKMAAKNLLENPPSSIEELMHLYYSEYGCYNYVTSVENTKLRPFQKKGVFISPKDSYEKAGINLVRL
jgi:hypothetical protein